MRQNRQLVIFVFVRVCVSWSLRSCNPPRALSANKVVRGRSALTVACNRPFFAHLTPLKNFAMLTSFRAFAPKTAEFRLLPTHAVLSQVCAKLPAARESRDRVGSAYTDSKAVPRKAVTAVLYGTLRIKCRFSFVDHIF